MKSNNTKNQDKQIWNLIKMRIYVICMDLRIFSYLKFTYELENLRLIDDANKVTHTRKFNDVLYHCANKHVGIFLILLPLHYNTTCYCWKLYYSMFSNKNWRNNHYDYYQMAKICPYDGNLLFTQHKTYKLCFRWVRHNVE